MIDVSTEFGARVERRLREDVIAWLVTVRKDGTPQPIPVWFLWEAETFLVYSQPKTAKLRNIARNPRVALHLDGDGRGGDMVVIAGEAFVSNSDPPADEVLAYVEKYAALIERLGWTARSMAADYSVPLRIRFQSLHGH